MADSCGISKEARGVFEQRGLMYGEPHAKSLANRQHARSLDSSRNFVEFASGASHAPGLPWRDHTGRQSQTRCPVWVRRGWVGGVCLLLSLRRLWLLSALRLFLLSALRLRRLCLSALRLRGLRLRRLWPSGLGRTGPARLGVIRTDKHARVMKRRKPRQVPGFFSGMNRQRRSLEQRGKLDSQLR